MTDTKNPLEETVVEIAEESESLDLNTQPEPELEIPSSESMESQLEKLAEAISQQVVTDLAQATEIIESSQLENAEQLLAQQIAEDQALLKEENEALESSGDEAVPLQIQMDIAEIQSCIEALLFISDKPISFDKIRESIGPSFPTELYHEALAQLQQRFQSPHHGIELIEVAGGYQFRTKLARAPLAQKLVKVQTQRLSGGSMETLAIIAYKQPVMKEEVDQIRGVDSSYFIRGLMDKKLIKISGRSELPGRPLLYGTTPEFLEIFGLKDLSSLPSLRELEQMVPNSQTANPEDEDPRIRDMRRLVREMKSDQSSAINYNPKEDEKILKEIRAKVSAIPTSTPYLDELKAAELLAEQQAQMALQPAPAEAAPAPAEAAPAPAAEAPVSP